MIAWPPNDSGAAVESVAWPPERAAAGWGAPSTVKTTLPVGVPAPGATGATAAVTVTGWPKTEGLADEDSAVVVEAWFHRLGEGIRGRRGTEVGVAPVSGGHRGGPGGER